ncbi:MAG: peptide-methionine (S)-S-oxide reductase MsrA [Gammaproteobacteria bacterium]
MSPPIKRATAAIVLALCAGFSGAGLAATAKATFAGGCFWCTESDFEKVPGVISAVSGYIGGSKPDPSYEEVSAGGTGHAEAVEIVFDPAKVSYQRLLYIYWRSIDPTAKDRQFCDVGSQYRSAIFTHDETQRKLAEASKTTLKKSGKLTSPIQTQIVAAGSFYPAEDYHQNYYKKNPLRYRYYRYSCGREARLQEIWGDEAGAH